MPADAADACSGSAAASLPPLPLPLLLPPPPPSSPAALASASPLPLLFKALFDCESVKFVGKKNTKKTKVDRMYCCKLLLLLLLLVTAANYRINTIEREILI